MIKGNDISEEYEDCIIEFLEDNDYFCNFYSHFPQFKKIKRNLNDIFFKNFKEI